MARIWVFNASPLMILGTVGRLSLVEEVPEEWIIPSGVKELAGEAETGT